MTCFLVCMLLALALRSITCQEVRGHRTSPNEALKDVWPHDRCDQPRVSVQRSFPLVQPHNVPGESNGAHASPSHTCQAMGVLHPAVFKDYRSACLYRSPSVVRKLAQSSRRQGNDDGLPTLQPDRITQAPRVTPADLECDLFLTRMGPEATAPDGISATHTGGSVVATPSKPVTRIGVATTSRLTVLQEWYVVTTPGHTALASSSRVSPSHESRAQNFKLGKYLSDKPQLVGRVAAPKNRTLIRQGTGVGGLVDATPCLNTIVFASLVQGRQLADRFVVSTPQPFARSSDSHANRNIYRVGGGASKSVDNPGTGPPTFEPPNTACNSASITHVPCRNASGHLWLTSSPARGSDSAVAALNCHVHSSVIPLPATQDMSGSTELYWARPVGLL